MKLEITIERDDIEQAIIDWCNKQPIMKTVSKDLEVCVGWTGGSTVIVNGKKRTDEE